jgi:hemolysin activation/secretion protein
MRAFGLIGAGLAASAPAQVPPPVPRPPTREEVEQPRPRPGDQAPARLKVEGGIERSPCPLADPAYAGIEFTLGDVVFQDLKGLDPAALAPAWKPYQGSRINLAAICEIRDSAAAMLRDAGYIAAIEIPEQRIAGGTIRFDVLMAKIVAIRVRGDAGRSEPIIGRYLAKLSRQEVFNRRDAERYLLLAGDLPGFDVRLTLKSAGGARGEVVGEVMVARRKGQVDFNVQDYGSRELGRWGLMVRGQAFALTGLGDRTSLALFTTSDLNEQQNLQVGHEMRIGGEGLTLGGDMVLSWAEPAIGQPGIRLSAKTLLATFSARYPFVRGQAENLSGSAGIDLIDQKVRFNGLPLNRDKLRIAFVRLEADATDQASIVRAGGFSAAEPRWRVAGRIEARKGMGILGASSGCGPALTLCLAPGAVPPSRFEGDPEAALLRAEVYGEFRPIPIVAFSLAARAQRSRDPLFAFEEFSAGNYTIGRGYDPGTLLGDSGFGVQAEFRVGSLVPRTPRSVAVQPYVFVDAARVSNRDRLFVVAGRDRLTSAGGGVRAALGDQARLDVALAVPLTRAGLQTKRGNPRLLVSLTTALWPWSFK